MIGKRVGLLAGAIIVSLLLLEVGTRAIHRIREGEPFPAEALRERLAPTEDLDRLIPATAPALQGRGVPISNKVLHPYLGYVYDRTGREATGLRINRFGFRGLDPLTKPAPGAVRIAIAGGSVAGQLFADGARVLRKSLGASPSFAGKRIELIALTAGGYKQPQQLLALTWLLSLGARFDVVINLDGFNEVVLPVAENALVGVHSSFPRSWDTYQGKAIDPGRVAHAAETRRLLVRQREWRHSLGTGAVSVSAFALTLLSRIDAQISEEIAAHDAAFRQRLNRAGLGFQARGPFVPVGSRAMLLGELTALWKNASLEMHQLTTGAGGRYFHFLQPNQWVPDAKPLSGIERSQLRKLRGHFVPRTVVPAAYRLLSQAGTELQEEGVSFQSLVPLFREEHRTVYRDTCCHFNRRGISAIAREIARVVSEELEP